MCDNKRGQKISGDPCEKNIYLIITITNEKRQIRMSIIVRA
jgi:hypothetical protein